MPIAPLVIVNPTAGGGRASRSVAWLSERLVDWPNAKLEVTRRRGDAEALAADAIRLGHDRVIAVGGDGTVQEIVNGLLAPSDPAELGILPVGSGNDLARSLQVPRHRVDAWMTAIGDRTRQIDAALATNGREQSRWFVSAGGIGFDAQVAAAMERRSRWQTGRTGYLLTTLRELLRFTNRSVTLTIDGVTTSEDVLLIAIANGAYYGGGMRIAPAAAVDDGLLDLCIVGNLSRVAAVGQLANLYRGTHVGHPSVSIRSGSEIVIEGDAHTRTHLDGEPFGTLPLRVSVRRGALRVAG